MTNLIAITLTLSLSFLFGVDRPKEIETSSQNTTEIQFNTEVFQKNLHIKKEIIQNYKQVRKAKSIERDKEALRYQVSRGNKPLSFIEHFNP